MKKLALLFVVLMVASANAGTIFEQVDVTSGWTVVEDTVNYFDFVSGYDGGYYLSATTYFPTGVTEQTQARITKPGLSLTQADELWMEIDMRFETSDAAMNYQNSLTGVMNSADTINEKNAIYNRGFFYKTGAVDETARDRGNRTDPYAYNSDGAEKSANKSNPKWGWSVAGRQLEMAGTEQGDLGYRSKLHYWQSAGVGYATYSVYEINADGSTGTKMYDSTTIDDGSIYNIQLMASGSTYSADVFGIGNRSTNLGNKSSGAGSQTLFVDDFYMSTTGANADPVLPSWIPEPATVALLGLGALVLRRRK